MPVCCGLKSNRCQVPSSEPLSLTQGLCPIRSVCSSFLALQHYSSNLSKGQCMKQAGAREKDDLWESHAHTLPLCVFKPKWPLVEISRQRTETKHKNTGGARSYLQPPARGPCADKFLDVRGVISKRQTTYSSGAHLCRHFCNSHRGNKRFCAGGGWNCVCVCYYFLIVLRHANAWKATGKISSLRQTKANIGALRWEG